MKLTLALLFSISSLCAAFAGETDPFEKRVDAYLSQKFPARILKVEVSADEVHVEGEETGVPVVLAALAEVRASETVMELENATFRVAGVVSPDPATRHFSVRVPRFDGGYDRVLSKWAVLQKVEGVLTLASTARYADTLPAPAKVPPPLLKAANKKGLNGVHMDPRLYPDLVELGVGHLALNIFLGGLLATERDKETLTWNAFGRELKLNKRYVDRFDELLRFAEANRMVSAAIILIPREFGNKELQKELVHPKANSGPYSLTNVTDERGITLYAALLKFLAERYSGADGAPNGRLTHWILHNEVDSAHEWTNNGDTPFAQFVEEYHRSLRVAYLTVRTAQPQAKVFISLTHSWTRANQGKPGYYASRRILERINQYSRAEGDFEWGVAYHPYPQNLFNPATWNDTEPRDDFETPKITLKNIEVLDRFLRQPAFLYQGKTIRTVLLSEQGFHSGKNDEAGQRLQAAALAYTFEKINMLDSIEAFHYHRWIDHEKEGGLNLGLWTVKPGSITMPDQKKLGHAVFKAIGTAQEEEVLREYRGVYQKK